MAVVCAELSGCVLSSLGVGWATAAPAPARWLRDRQGPLLLPGVQSAKPRDALQLTPGRNFPAGSCQHLLVVVGEVGMYKGLFLPLLTSFCPPVASLNR